MQVFHTCVLPVGVRVRTSHGREARVGGAVGVGHWVDPTSGCVGVTTDDGEHVIIADHSLSVVTTTLWEA